MDTNPEQDALRSRWTLEGRIPLSGIADGAEWRRARSVTTGELVVLFIVRGEAALEAADAVRRAYLVEDPRLLPVQEIVVLDDPREDDADAPAPPSADGSAGDEGSGTPHGATTVVEYPLPPAPPLAALLSQGALHPETARAIVGEAASGLETARRRGVRHQFLDSNRLFVDTRSGTVSILGIGVEAAAHPGLDRSRETASFQDTAALVALLYRALTGRSPQHDATGHVPRPSTVTDSEIPRDLDLLCDLVLNETGEDIPETTRGLIEALEPWQSIPVTLEAYARTDRRSATEAEAPATSGAGGAGVAGAAGAAGVAGAAGAAPIIPREGAPGADGESATEPTTTDGQAPAGTDGPAAAESSSGTGAAGSESGESGTARSEGPEPTPRSTSEHTSEDGSGSGAEEAPSAAPAAGAAAAGAAGAAAATGLAAAGRPEEGGAQEQEDSAQAEKTQDQAAPAGDHTSPRPAPQETEAPAGAQQAETQQDQAQQAATQQADAEQSQRASAEARALVDDLHLTETRSRSAFPGHLDITAPAAGQEPAGATPSPSDGDPSTTSPGAAAAATGGAVAAGGAAAALAPTSAEEGSRPSQPSSERSTSAATPDHSAPTPSHPVTHSADGRGTGPVAVPGRAAGSDAAREDGPIVVHGRDRSLLDATPEESTVPAARSSLLRDVVGVAVDTDAPETFTMGPRDRERRSLQSQWIIIGGAIIVMIALVIALTSITRDLRDIVDDPLATSQAPSATPTEEDTGEAPAEPTAEATEDELPPPELAGAELFSEGTEKDPDNADQLDRVTDGDPETYWSTQHYGGPDYGGLKDGVGFTLSFAETATLKTVTVTTAMNNGGSIELRAVNDDGSLGDVLASGEFVAGGEVRLDTPEPLETDEVALWINELPPDSKEDGRFRARIAEIQVE